MRVHIFIILWIKLDFKRTRTPWIIFLPVYLHKSVRILAQLCYFKELQQLDHSLDGNFELYHLSMNNLNFEK